MKNRLKTTMLTLLATGLAASIMNAEEWVAKLETPTSGSETTYPFPGFTWSGQPEAFKDDGKPVEYEIQIASDAGFTNLSDEDRVAINRYVHDKPLAPGTYHWRVRAILTAPSRRGDETVSARLEARNSMAIIDGGNP